MQVKNKKRSESSGEEGVTGSDERTRKVAVAWREKESKKPEPEVTFQASACLETPATSKYICFNNPG